MAISGVSAVNKVSEVTAFEATDFILAKLPNYNHSQM